MSDLREKAREITNLLYAAYGTDYGWIFGIPPEYRGGVEIIVLATLERVDKKPKEEVKEG